MEHLTDITEEIRCPFCKGSNWGLAVDMSDVEYSEEEDMDEDDIIEEMMVEGNLKIESCEIDTLNKILLQAKCECGGIFQLNMDNNNKTIKLENNIN